MKVRKRLDELGWILAELVPLIAREPRTMPTYFAARADVHLVLYYRDSLRVDRSILRFRREMPLSEKWTAEVAAAAIRRDEERIAEDEGKLADARKRVDAHLAARLISRSDVPWLKPKKQPAVLSSPTP